MALNAQRAPPPAPPARGSFPLDHGGQCKPQAEAYLKCIKSKESGAAHNDCKELSRLYLECRMQRNLMAQEDLDTLGFGKDSVVVPPTPEQLEAQRNKNNEIIAGLSAAKKAKGGFLGIALPGLKDKTTDKS